MKPITPAEALDYKRSKIPELVYEAFNRKIKEAYDGQSALVWQNEVVDQIMELMPSVARDHIFEKGWLNVEHAYLTSGWEVLYDNTGYSDPYYTFVKI